MWVTVSSLSLVASIIFIALLFATLDWFSRRNPMGIARKILQRMNDSASDPEITTPEGLAQLPEGTFIVDARQLILERHRGVWMNSRGRRQNRVTLPVRIIE